MSGILALPMTAFAASSVRTLGGAGTYNGVTSVGSGTATRAGSVRAVPAVKVSKTTTSATTSPSTSGSTGTVSGNTGTGTRMSIGKYLSGSGVVSSKVSTSTSAAGYEDDIASLTDSIVGLRDDIDALTQKLDLAKEDLDILKSNNYIIDNDDVEAENYLTEAEIKALEYIDETALNKALTDLKLAETYATKEQLGAIQDQLDIASVIAASIDDFATKAELSGYATTTDLSALSESTRRIVGDAKDALNARINSVEADISSFSVYDGAFNPDKLDVE